MRRIRELIEEARAEIGTLRSPDAASPIREYRAGLVERLVAAVEELSQRKCSDQEAAEALVEWWNVTVEVPLDFDGRVAATDRLRALASRIAMEKNTR